MADRAYWEREYIASEFKNGMMTHLEWMEAVWGGEYPYGVEFEHIATMTHAYAGFTWGDPRDTFIVGTNV